ncbi:MAG: hypothetical protein PHU04_02360 [Candidatus Peribacteraceae bacterium]|nr:hypothetical protein [Candidatus Peribacteraceae bacterium]
MKQRATASGKIILSGEYAVVFGYPGIAMPAPIGIQAIFEPSQQKNIELRWEDAPQEWLEYLGTIVERCGELGAQKGKISIVNQIPLGKGMGSSTALVIGVTRAFLGQDCRTQALTVEDAVNPGHSGLDFAVIWEGKPVLFQKGETVQPISLPASLLQGALLIDTGTPNETTPELIAWVKEREQELMPHLKTIGECTERLATGENLQSVLRDHHRAQVALGVVPEGVRKFIAEIERAGGAGKVLGAGARTGGGGIVLAIGNNDVGKNEKWKMENGWRIVAQL